MPLLEIIPSEKLIKMSSREFKKTANEHRKGLKSVARRLHISRRDVEEFKSKKSLKPAEKRKHQKLYALVIELGQEEQGYVLQQKELDKAVQNWFL